MLLRIILIISFLISFQGLTAQQSLEIVIIFDRPGQDSELTQNSFKDEIDALLAANYQINFIEFETQGDIQATREYVEEIYEDNTADVLIGAGLIISQVLLERKEYPLPTIAAVNLDNLFSENKDSTKTSSSIDNFTYIQSPFDIEKDLKVLAQFTKLEKLGILVDPVLVALDYDIQKFYRLLNGVAVELITIENDPQITLDAIDTDIDAVYVLSPLDTYSPSQSITLFQGIAKKKLPSLSLLDYPMLNYGAYAAFSSSENFRKIPRRIALQVSKIAEGQNPKDFPVRMESFASQLLINMETVNKTGVYPMWEIIDNAILININKIDAERKINLESTIAEGLENNLGYHIEQKQTKIVEKNVSIAKSNYLPQVDISTTGLLLDKNTVDNSFGSKGRFNWSSGASFSQLIISEPALANISIQKLLMESQQNSQKESELDVVLDVVKAYFNYQQVQSIVLLQNENIKVKYQNLNIAINKERVGYSGVSDVYRWETELASAKADFNSAEAQLKMTKFILNQTLNRPISEDFIIDQPEASEYISQLFDIGAISLIQNTRTVKKLANFLVAEAMNNLPEIRQIQLAIEAQERLLLSNKRESYIPSVILAANYGLPISVISPGEIPIPGFEGGSNNPSWDIALVASFPVFAGGYRKHQTQKSQIELFQLQDQQLDVRNKLELQIRVNLENLIASYRNYELNNDAAASAGKNVSIVQDLYNQGQVNVTTLIDAQNAYLGSQINATNSAYQFIIDMFVLERSTGQYISLGTEDQHADYLTKFIQFND